MKLRRQVPDYTTPDWVRSLQEVAGPHFGKKTFKNDEKFGFGSPYFEKVWIHPRSTLKKNYRSIYLS